MGQRTPNDGVGGHHSFAEREEAPAPRSLSGQCLLNNQKMRDPAS